MICIFMVYTNHSCGGHPDDATWTIYANFCVLTPGRMSLSGLVYIDRELIIDRGNFVHSDFLKPYCIRSKITHVGHLAVGHYQVTAMLTTLP